LYANYDGEPEIACEEFHVGVGPNPNPDFICEACEWKQEDERAEQALAEDADDEALERAQ
jgi:hypothetical protein